MATVVSRIDNPKKRRKKKARAGAPTVKLEKAKLAADRTARAKPEGNLDSSYPYRFSWASVTWLVVLHAGALAAPFFFSWQGLALAVFLHWLTGGVGICLGYHRMLTHTGFKSSRPVRGVISWLGTMAGQGSPIEWVADHRKHHAHSDQEGDPHSPHEGAWWSHMLWLTAGKTREHYQAHVERWAPDLLKEPFLRFLTKTFLLWHVLAGGALFLTGWLTGGVYMGFSLMTWGLFARLVFVLHSTWFVNSASHMWGYRNYETTDDSRNNWWVALITYGEGWHNNHHAWPRMAKHGHKWWEFDATFALVRVLQRLGLVWDVVDYKHASEKKARAAA